MRESEGSIHQIYQIEGQITQEKGNDFSFLKRQESQESLAHLICDFDEIDVEQAFKNYRKAVQKTTLQSQQSNIKYNKESNKKQKARMKSSSRIVITAIDYVPSKITNNLNHFLRKGLPEDSLPRRSYEFHSPGYKANYDKKILEFQKKIKFTEINRDFFRPELETNMKTERYSHEKYNQTYTIRNEIQFRNLNTQRSSNNLEVTSGPWNEGKPTTSISPPHSYRHHPQEQTLEFCTDLQFVRPDGRNMIGIKEKAMALLNGAKTTQNYRAETDRHFAFSNRFG